MDGDPSWPAVVLAALNVFQSVALTYLAGETIRLRRNLNGALMHLPRDTAPRPPSSS